MEKILIVVDMQNDFIDGSLGTPEARKIVFPVVDKIKKRRKEGYEIVLTMDTHSENYLHTQEGSKLPVPHCVRGTYGWQLNPLVGEAARGCKIYEKDTFGSRELFLDLRKSAPEKIEIVGLCTDICVVSNALGIKAFLPETAISVDAGCCAGVSVRGHNAAVETMKSCQIDVE